MFAAETPAKLALEALKQAIKDAQKIDELGKIFIDNKTNIVVLRALSSKLAEDIKRMSDGLDTLDVAYRPMAEEGIDARKALQAKVAEALINTPMSRQDLILYYVENGSSPEFAAALADRELAVRADMENLQTKLNDLQAQLNTSKGRSWRLPGSRALSAEYQAERLAQMAAADRATDPEKVYTKLRRKDLGRRWRNGLTPAFTASGMEAPADILKFLDKVKDPKNLTVAQQESALPLYAYIMDLHPDWGWTFKAAAPAVTAEVNEKVRKLKEQFDKPENKALANMFTSWVFLHRISLLKAGFVDVNKAPTKTTTGSSPDDLALAQAQAEAAAAKQKAEKDKKEKRDKTAAHLKKLATDAETAVMAMPEADRLELITDDTRKADTEAYAVLIEIEKFSSGLQDELLQNTGVTDQTMKLLFAIVNSDLDVDTLGLTATLYNKDKIKKTLENLKK